MDGPHVALDIRIPSDVNYIEGVVELAALKCRELHIPPRKCTLNVRVALAEALANAILRGNGGAGKHVRLTATVSDDALVFDIADEGPGFSMLLKDPTSPENIELEDGRGLFLMHQLMDRVELLSEDGNVVRLTLKRK